MSDSQQPPQQRSRTPEPPYCWQSKAARRIIYEYFDGDTFGSSVLGVYAALTEIASDNKAETFTAPQSYIAHKSCLGVSTVGKALKELRALGLLAYETPRLRGPITFTLVATRRTFGTTQRTFGTTQRTFGIGRNRDPLPTLEEYIEEVVEEVVEEPRAKPEGGDLPASATSEILSAASSSDAAAQRSELSAERPELIHDTPLSSDTRNNKRSNREKNSSPEESTAGAGEGFSSSAVSVAGLSFADRFRASLPNKVSLVAGWRAKWARAYDDLLRLDKRDQDEIERVWQWARRDEFWAPQFQSPLKLRKRNREGVTYYDVFLAKLNGDQPRRRRKDPPI
jgi:hypothetical protein